MITGKRERTWCRKQILLPRKAGVRFNQLSHEEQDELIKKDPRYGNIICKCEQISEGEILDAMRSPVPPKSVDAIKHRTRAGMGRCGRFLPDQSNRTFGKRVWNGLDRDSFKRRGFTDSPEEK